MKIFTPMYYINYTVAAIYVDVITSLYETFFFVAARDAIAKATYDRLFRWVVNQVNRLLAPDINYVHSICEIGEYCLEYNDDDICI